MASTPSLNSSPLALSVDQRALADVAKLLKNEADGKLLRRELSKALRSAADRPIAKAKSEIMAAPSRGLTTSQPLRSTVARSIKPSVRLSGRQTGVSIRQSATPNLRGFRNAGRKFNRASFRHPVHGNRQVWVTQRTHAAGWFDRPMRDSQPEFKAEVLRVVQDLADTLAARAAAH